MPTYATMREYIEGESGETLSRTNKAVKALAKKSKLSTETIYRDALGDRPMSRYSAALLSKATGDVMSTATILRLDQPAKPRGKK